MKQVHHFGRSRQGWVRGAQKSPSYFHIHHILRPSSNTFSVVDFPKPISSLSSKSHPNAFIYSYVCVKISSFFSNSFPSTSVCIAPKPSSALHIQLLVLNNYWMKCFQLCVRDLPSTAITAQWKSLSPLSMLTSSSHLSLLLTVV